MLSLILFIIIFAVVVVLIIVSTILSFIRSIFGFGKRTAPTNPTQDLHQQTNKSKIFDKTEGEYVDYEEIK